jgi:cytosine/adenosine deaminase-related metal-dependent hydrolase
LKTGIAPHSLREVDPGALKELVTGLDSIDRAAPIHIHCAEQAKEVDDCVQWSGKPRSNGCSTTCAWMSGGVSCMRRK